ncbi:hypothetical protein OQA88_8270 [Cercophora sp. LCS_1]
MSFQSSQHAVTPPPLSLEQLQSSASTMSRSDYCNAHLARDAPFAAFHPVGKSGRIGKATVAGRKSARAKTAKQTVARACPGAGSGTPWSPSSAMNSTDCYPIELTDEDLFEIDERDASSRL